MAEYGTGLQFEGQTKPDAIAVDGYESALFAARITEIPSNMGMRVAYDGSGNAEYVGFAPRGLAEGTDGWLLQKFTYDGSNRCTKREIAYGNWTNRASESYA
jgi:hypothetical protein